MAAASQDIQPVLPAYDEAIPAANTNKLSDDNIKQDESNPCEPLPGYASVGPVLPPEVLQAALLDIAGSGSPEHSVYHIPPNSQHLPDAETLYKHTLSELDRPVYLRRLPYDSREEPACHAVIKAFFEAIRDGSTELVSQFLIHGLLDANTPGIGHDYGSTPLIHAIQHKRRATIELLLAHGANVDDFGIVYPRDVVVSYQYSDSAHDKASMRPHVRTPLQVACTEGDLVTVRLLHTQYHADDTLVAPDGQIALRLASQGKHTEIVAYLPARRGGAWKRIKAKNRRLVHRARKSALDVADVLKTVVYTIPKWLGKCMYDVLREGATHCWQNRQKIIPALLKWCRRLGRAIVHLPETIREVTIDVSKFTVSLVTTRIPNAIAAITKFTADALVAIAKSLWNVVNRFLSALSTLFSYLIMQLRGLTWSDIRHACTQVLSGIFISFPQALWKAAGRIGRGVKDALVALFGCLGKVIWHSPRVLGKVVLFLLKPVWRLVEVVVGTMGAAGREVRFLFNPKG